MIHPTAVVASSVKVPSSCSVGPYCVLGEGVELGEYCELMSHVVVHGPAQIGTHNRFFPFCCIGAEPQDTTYAGQPTRVKIGDHNICREYVTVNRGTAKGGGLTTLGSHILMLAYSHIGHDCTVGDHAMLINAATLAGHVSVGEWAVIGAFSAVHQFCRVGAHAYIGGGTMATKDVLPFSTAVSPRDARTYGLNSVGLERRGFTKERIRKIHHAFRVLLNSKLNTSQALEKLHAESEQGEDVEMLLRFVAESKRGVIK